MTPIFGKESRAKLRTCHPDLQLIFNEVIKYYDTTILEGVRSDERQKDLFDEGLSKCDGKSVKSKHQRYVDGYSYAVDAVPYPVEWGDIKRFFFLAGIVISTSERLYAEGKISHKIRWGHDWDNDRLFNDQTFNDSPHYELYKP